MPDIDELAQQIVAPPHPYSPGFLDREIRDVMTPGVVVVPEDASVEQTARAIAAHGVHAVLVLALDDGAPIGWVTARGLLGWVGREQALACAREAITEKVTMIEPGADVRAAVGALATPGVTRLAVRRRMDGVPEGVITDFDLAVPATP